MANQVTVAQLAFVQSAQIITSQDSSVRLLEVVAQGSGFNWKLHICVPEILIDPPEYWPYQVIEVKEGSNWPINGGLGPVVPRTTLYQSVTNVGTKGIEVIGSNETITLDLST